MSTVAGAMEPCGCRKDMLGGIDHAAALLAAEAPQAPARLLLAVGPLFFQEPQLDAKRREQDLWKAETLATSLGSLNLAAWAPGQNDFAAGPSVLAELVKKSGTRVLGAGQDVGEAHATSTAVFEVGSYTVGVAGVGASIGSDPDAAARALAEAGAALDEAGAEIRVLLLAAPRGEALRLAERVPGFDVIALGKPVESGDANDAVFPPTLIGETLVVQAPNHLQALAYVDLFVRDKDFSFEDAVGIEAAERRESVKSRVADLEARLARSAASDTPSESRSAALNAELSRAKAELLKLEQAAAAPREVQGSTFRYAEELVRESRGSDPNVARSMSDYYRRVNDHNKQVFAGLEPPPVPQGASGYVGQNSCSFCHRDAYDFWKGTQHAGAYATLSREFKEYNLDCVSCHVTGYGRAGGSTVTHVDKLKDVQCEACHGAGERHAASGGDTRLITLKPAESVCRACHHTPHVADDWDLQASWSKIIGEGHGAPDPEVAASPEATSSAGAAGHGAGGSSPTGGHAAGGTSATGGHGGDAAWWRRFVRKKAPEAPPGSPGSAAPPSR
jgi:hypothetical protein